MGAYHSIASAQIQENVEIQKLFHQTNIEKARAHYNADAERERLAVNMTLVVDALEILETTVQTRLAGIDEDIKQQFIEEYFNRLLNKYVGEIDSNNERSP